MKAALKIEQLYKSFKGVVAVNHLNLEIRPGEIFGLLGPNGAGKSTTINMVGGVTRIQKGKIEVFGWDNQKDYRETRRRIGLMHQEVVIDPYFTIGRTLQIYSGYFGVRDDPKWRKLLIERLALGPHLEKHMRKLSGGMKRRFMVAKALIHKPQLLILDEPTAGVDVELRRTLWDFVREINREGTTVLLTTHYLEEAEEMCGRVAIMNHGEVIALDETQKLIRRMETRKLSVRIGSEIPQIPDALRKYQLDLLESGKDLVFWLTHDLTAGQVLSDIQSLGLEIIEVDTTVPSLEDVFVSMTREGVA